MVRLLGRCIPIFCMPKKKRQSLPIAEQQTIGTKHHQDEINKLFVRRVESIRVTQQAALLKRCPSPKISGRQQQNKKTKSKATPASGKKLIKPDDTEFDCETHISDRQTKPKTKSRLKSKKKLSSIKQKQSIENNNPSRYRTSLDKLFHKTNKPKSKVPSPTPSSANIVNIPEKEQHDTCTSISSASSSSSVASISSDWSSTTYSDSNSSEKSKHVTNSNRRRQSMPASNLANRNQERKHRSCVENFFLGNEHARQTALSPPTRAKPISLNLIDDHIKNRNSSLHYNKRDEIKPTAKSKQVLQNVRKMIKDRSIQEQHFNEARQRESVRL